MILTACRFQRTLRSTTDLGAEKRSSCHHFRLNVFHVKGNRRTTFEDACQTSCIGELFRIGAMVVFQQALELEVDELQKPYNQFQRGVWIGKSVDTDEHSGRSSHVQNNLNDCRIVRRFIKDCCRLRSRLWSRHSWRRTGRR